MDENTKKTQGSGIKTEITHHDPFQLEKGIEGLDKSKQSMTQESMARELMTPGDKEKKKKEEKESLEGCDCKYWYEKIF